MADRIVILNGGEIAQQGTPEEVYNRPASEFVAAFMGAENELELPVRVSGDRIEIAGGEFNDAAVLPARDRDVADGMVRARFRSEAAEILETNGRGPGDAGLILNGQVEQTSYPGGVWRHVVSVGARKLMVDAARSHAAGARVRVRVPDEALFLFSRRG